MTIAWDNGYRRLAIQTDSVCAVQLLKSQDIHNHPHAALVLKFQELSRCDWDLKITHIYREANFMADSIAKEGYSLPLGLHLLDERHPAVASWIAYDHLRSSQPYPHPWYTLNNLLFVNLKRFCIGNIIRDIILRILLVSNTLELNITS
ncbi:Putative ribonuclease H protein At1g65750 [Linum grandiflorum]